ncbi:hypothetical protein [Acidipropionibacterium jensenii]|uniref:hypothetical protein n=1 Tax=Acidipropionibacterium jensenii TaxID=1749 RepID=UPI00214B0E2D|nr:hypothetical protein [Acidipropionibacterium jensenii]
MSAAATLTEAVPAGPVLHAARTADRGEARTAGRGEAARARRQPRSRPRRPPDPGSTGQRLRRQWLDCLDQPWADEAIAELRLSAGTLPQQLPDAIRADRSVAHSCILAAQGDGPAAELACQALLQVLFPMLVRMASRDPDPREALDDYLAAAWIRIRTVRVGPATTVPTGLGLDALHAVTTARRRIEGHEIPQQISDVEAPPPQHRESGRAVAVLEAAMSMGVLSGSQLSVLASVYFFEMSSADAAAAHRISAAALRARCSRAVRTMRRHAAVLREYLE